ncbi:hypothetical protein ACSS6W_009730 [Trichoderma asperelloides]
MSVQTKPSNEKVIPLSAKDQWRPISNIRSLAFIVVRDILDGEFMKESLEKLVKEHIPLLSSRIKPSRTDGWLQYHLTSPLPDNYDILGWSVSNVGTTIGESKLVPEQSSQKGITILPDVTTLESCWIPADWPILRNQDKPETPLLLVHLTYYTDATIVAVSLPHCVSDQLGLGSVISSWTDLMQDKELVPFIDLPEVRGFHTSLPKSHKYLHNALVFAPTHAAISRSKPAASEIAYRTRLAIVQSLQPANMERGLAVARELYLHNILMHICEPWEFSYGVTNWCNAWHGIDFSAASIRRAEQGVEKMDEGDGAVPAPLVFGHALERNHPNRLIATIMSKGEGGYWVDFAAPNKGMEAIKALLRNDPNLETI